MCTTSWKRLKHYMRKRFIPPHYKRDMKKKLQCFDQGHRSVNDYYNELLVAIQRCGIVENDDDTMTRVYAGLRKDIQNLVNYKEYDTTDRLYHIAMLAEQELHDRNEQRSRLSFGNSYSSSRFPSAKGRVGQDLRSRPPAGATSLPSPAKPEVSKSASVPQVSKTDAPSTSSTANIVCHRCHGRGHVMRDCPSKRAYIVTEEGGYVSTSDVEDELVLQTNVAGSEEDDGYAFGEDDVADYTPNGTYVVQRVLSAQVEQADKFQQHNLFQICFIIHKCRVRSIIDGGSCSNLVSADLVKKFGITTRVHSHPYHIQWLNNSRKAKVTHTARVHFSIGTYHDYADCDVVPMQACSLLLDRPWEFDTDATHHGRTNTYTFMHNGKKITLLPMTPAEIIKCDKTIAEPAKRLRLTPHTLTQLLIHRVSV